jgi:hypothetical protein
MAASAGIVARVPDILVDLDVPFLALPVFLRSRGSGTGFAQSREDN